MNMTPLNAAFVSLLALALIGGCAAPDDRTYVNLMQGESAYQAKQYDTAVEQLTVYLKTAKGSPEVARAQYVRGMALARNGNRPAAYSDLELAAQAKTDPDITWRAQAVLGVMYFEDSKWGAAVQSLERAVNGMPAGPPMDALLWRLGLSRERCGRWSDALAAYQQIVTRFPGGSYADNSSRRLQLRADHYRVQCGAFANPAGADQLLAELRANGLLGYTRQEQRSSQSLYVVYVGRYNTYEQANKVLAQARNCVPGAVLWP